MPFSFMQSDFVQIILLSLASDQDQSQLKDQLGTIGYPNVISLNSKVSNPIHQSSNGILILQHASGNRNKTSVIEAIHNCQTTEVLGLFDRNNNHWDDELAQLCSEVSLWPCNQNELTFRLKRLSQNSVVHTDLVKDVFFKMHIMGDSPSFDKISHKTYKISKYDVPVLLMGETGTGKELFARAIHNLSHRSNCPFVAFNCGAIPDNLFENELFGHEEGAYTDARSSKEGLVSLAEGGTLFLDEIETLSPKGQITLLRFLQELEYRPLGGRKTKKANIRIVAATNQSIPPLIEKGLFRQDLFYRLSVMEIELPPLKERTSDIPVLANYFLKRLKEKYNQPGKYLHSLTLEEMRRYPWPGNVRELENLLHREFLLSETNCIQINFLQLDNKDRRSNSYDRRTTKFFDQPLLEGKRNLIESFEIEYLKCVLSRAHGNISEAARLAGKERRTFAKLLKKYALNWNKLTPQG